MRRPLSEMFQASHCLASRVHWIQLIEEQQRHQMVIQKRPPEQGNMSELGQMSVGDDLEPQEGEIRGL